MGRSLFLFSAIVLLTLGIPVDSVAGQDDGAVEEVCVLETSMGAMVFRFFDDAAPATVAFHEPKIPVTIKKASLELRSTGQAPSTAAKTPGGES